MGRGKEVNAASRALEYKRDGFYVHDRDVIMCKYCNSRVEWARKDSCQKHVGSKNHVSQKTKAESTTVGLVQSSIAGSFATQQKATEQKTEFLMDTTAMLLKVRIFPKLPRNAFAVC